MNFSFKNKELEKLYTTGKSKKLKLSNDIIEKFFARVQQIEAAENIYDLWNDKGLNFEKLKGTENTYSMRLKLKYRLEMEIDWQNSELTIGDFLLTDISNHYA
jgi:plasmid maintenance system killer protein